MGIETIIIRYLDGCASYEEKQTLLQWLKESEEHRGGFLKTRDIWLASNAALGSELEVDLALERFKGRLREMKEKQFRFSLNDPKWKVCLRSVAAVALLLILSGSMVWLYQNTWLFKQQTTVLITAPNSKGHFVLPDGSTVWLNKESKLTFSQHDFRQDRRVRLEGEAFFEVKKNTQSPFVVAMDEIDIQVLGTEFNVAHYLMDSCIEVTLNSGVVKLFGETLKKELRLRPGDHFVFNKHTHLYQLNQTNPYYYSIWKEEQLIFDDHPLNEIIPCLETWFRVKIECPDRLADSTHLTFIVRNETPEEIMRSISYITPIEYKIEDNMITIKEKKNLKSNR
ncbi:MAG: FecR family protein [Bacteroidales bacterium]